jgi:hypothetical protein
VRKFNRSLTDVAKNLNKVTAVNSVMEREYYTRHGLHLNGKSKEIMTKKVLTEIQEIIGLQTKNKIIPLTWKYTLHEYTKQSSQATNFIKTIRSDNTSMYNKKC